MRARLSPNSRTITRRARGVAVTLGVAAALTATGVTPVTAQSAGSSGSAGSSSPAPGGPCGQSGSGSLGGANLPWITGAPNGELPVLTGKTKAVQMVTGPGSPNNTMERFNVSGTDLGIMWDNDGAGGAHQTMVAFGDTVGDCDAEGDDWRSNVLFRSDTAAGTIGSGISLDSSPLDAPNHSKEVVPGFNLPTEYTTIPTAAVAVDGVQYMRVMGVQSWDEPGAWTTLYSALWSSSDNGESWQPDYGSTRANVAIDVPGVPNVDPRNADFQQSAFVKKDGYVYEFGTPSGRFGGAILARVPEAQIRDLNAYTYWNGTDWDPDLANARTVIDSPVSELSVQWNDYLGKYVAMYTDLTGLVIRQADNLQGPWSGTQTILSGILVPSIYGGFMHPWTSGQYLDFVATTWDRYNVIQFRTDLSGMRMAATDQADRPDPATIGEAARIGTELPSGEIVPAE